QVGYMVTGVGIGTAMAVNGAIAHAFAHILYKALLFMGVGAVLHMTGRSKATELGGLYRKMPWAFFYTVVGGLSISGFPLLSGFVSKSMIVAAAFEDHLNWAAVLMMMASVGTFLSVGLKLTYAIWFGKNNCSEETWQKAKDPGWNMHGAMILTSALCLFIGVYTPYLYRMLPNQSVHYEPYTPYHLAETLQVLAFTALGFWLFLKKLSPKAKISLDMDWFYRAPAPWLGRVVVGGVNRFFVLGGDAALAVAHGAARLARNPFQVFGRRGAPARDFDADRDRGPLGSPIAAALLLATVVVAWMYWR
ncbi:MAG: proton-conducting transporter membrane subunit, partial [Candidatus Krumholzibacteria bacterium]|nr:proton-conducting transporter membrane subunit [Candidatus Krumholzibacteria bacterium]